MNSILRYGICLAASVACSIALGAQALTKGNKVDLSSNGKTVSVHIGQTIDISLDANSTTGYSWAPATLSSKGVVKIISAKYVSSSHAHGTVGSGGHQQIVLKALKPGKVTFTTSYLRPWEKGAAGKRFKIVFVVVR